MIQAKELRIGNLISVKDENDVWNPKEATTRDIFNLLSAHDIVKACYEPIPITEELLLKFGFEKVSVAGWVSMGENYYRIGEFVIETKERLGFSYEWHKKFKDSAKYVTVFKYVHELQNLHFALTGKELQLQQLQPAVT